MGEMRVAGPGFRHACGGIASVAADKGDFETAVAMYRKAVALFPTIATCRRLAKTLLAANQIREAETELKHFSQSGRMTALAALLSRPARLDLNDLEGAGGVSDSDRPFADAEKSPLWAGTSLRPAWKA